jgi:hypothetical protein
MAASITCTTEDSSPRQAARKSAAYRMGALPVAAVMASPSSVSAAAAANSPAYT